MLLVCGERLPSKANEFVQNLQSQVLGLVPAGLLQDSGHSLPCIWMFLELSQHGLGLLLLRERIEMQCQSDVIEVQVSAATITTHIWSGSRVHVADDIVESVNVQVATEIQNGL